MSNEVVQRRCRRSPTGIEDCQGFTGGTGTTGATGGTGPGGFADLGLANFYALMPGDNADTVAPGTPVDFPQDGPTNGAVARTDANTFEILVAGIYKIEWQVSVDEGAGGAQLVVAVDDGPGFAERAETVVGRATGTTQLVGDTYLSLDIGDLVQIWNPTGNAVALTITPIAGGTHPVSATLSFTRVGS